jgi:hypothetical protein
MSGAAVKSGESALADLKFEDVGVAAKEIPIAGYGHHDRNAGIPERMEGFPGLISKEMLSRYLISLQERSITLPAHPPWLRA